MTDHGTMTDRRDALAAQGTDPDSMTATQVAGLSGTMAMLAEAANAREARKAEPFRMIDGGSGWQRNDSRNGWLHATGPRDCSPIRVTYPTGYDSRCGWCYLGAGHTEAAHELSKARHGGSAR